jgi:hypothetical protein
VQGRSEIKNQRSKSKKTDKKSKTGHLGRVAVGE